jgi:hypothetical protein
LRPDLRASLSVGEPIAVTSMVHTATFRGIDARNR